MLPTRRGIVYRPLGISSYRTKTVEAALSAGRTSPRNSGVVRWNAPRQQAW